MSEASGSSSSSFILKDALDSIVDLTKANTALISISGILTLDLAISMESSLRL